MMTDMATRAVVLVLGGVLATGVAACGESNEPDSGTSASDPSRTVARQTDAPQSDGRPAPSDGRPAPRGKGDRPAEGAEIAPEGSKDTSSAISPAAADRAEVRRVVEHMYRDFAEGDAAGVCRAMSKAVRREIAANVLDERPAPATTCEASMTKFVEAASASGIRENSLGVTVASVDVKGSNATATISLNGRSGGVRLIREQGQWRFGDTPLGQPQ